MTAATATAAVPQAPGVAVETATWRPVEVLDVEGWRVGVSGGLTRRANSVVPGREPADVEAAIDRVEALYRERGLPSVVRICSATAPADLDARLERRGYATAGRTQVRVVDLDPAAPRPTPPDGMTVDVADAPTDAWLRLWAGAKGFRPGTEAVARAVLLGCPAAYLTVTDGDGPTGVVRVARAGDWAALSCLAVAPAARRRGLGRALSGLALGVGTEQGARRAFLQVEQGNAPAAALYRAMGFVVAETYHYRQLG